MEQRFTVITLGVKDLVRSTAFFERLGWVRSEKQATGVAFFQCGGVAISLYPRSDLARDAGVSDEGSGFEGFAIAYNTRSSEEVDAVLSEAKSAGGEILRPARAAVWGGHSGYFRDLDGHLWEVAWNPGWSLDAQGAVNLPE